MNTEELRTRLAELDEELKTARVDCPNDFPCAGALGLAESHLGDTSALLKEIDYAISDDFRAAVGSTAEALLQLVRAYLSLFYRLSDDKPSR